MMAVANSASADTFGLGSNQFTIDFVNIDNAGNAPDDNGRGGVGYAYRIGKYEVTNAQWEAFIATAGTPTGNPSYAYNLVSYFTGDQQPTNRLSWYEAAQFCNYLTSGNKSFGAYQLGTDGSIAVARTAAISTYGTVYVIPTESEWYKAAYFKPDGSGYSLYANGTNTAPSSSQARYSSYSAPWNVGSGTQEQNGTYDMMGNIREWNESLYRGFYVHRGGAYGDDLSFLASSGRAYTDPSVEFEDHGFRVASIPEPATILLFGAAIPLLLRRKRKA
ncbi:MAG: SUMF1/EgtB/PvdO family nonheme iron enzyme [Sedimentisphaerales bacterium]|nr:SUMF1/EgtB/PvdO family nonheme iron enzyme [Sedimentisphaerales bacterium]